MSDDHSLPFPFRVVVSPAIDAAPRAEEIDSQSPPEEGGEGWSLDDIEAAYQQALESLDTLEETLADAIGEPDHSETDEALPLDSALATTTAGDGPPEPSKSFFSSTPLAAAPLAVTSLQVLEALLFVGGMTLPSRKLADVLSGSTSSEDVLRWIDELNATYDSEGRPYRIELVAGGYRMQLRSEFEKVRHRVFGLLDRG